MIDNKALWDALKSVDRLLSCAETTSELLSIEKKLYFEIRCIAAALYKDKIVALAKHD